MYICVYAMHGVPNLLRAEVAGIIAQDPVPGEDQTEQVMKAHFALSLASASSELPGVLPPNPAAFLYALARASAVLLVSTIILLVSTIIL